MVAASLPINGFTQSPTAGIAKEAGSRPAMDASNLQVLDPISLFDGA